MCRIGNGAVLFIHICWLVRYVEELKNLLLLKLNIYLSWRSCALLMKGEFSPILQEVHFKLLFLGESSQNLEFPFNIIKVMILTGYSISRRQDSI